MRVGPRVVRASSRAKHAPHDRLRREPVARVGERASGEVGCAEPGDERAIGARSRLGTDRRGVLVVNRLTRRTRVCARRRDVHVKVFRETPDREKETRR